MRNFYERVLGWASKRNILKGSTAVKQRTKTWEELTELAEGLSKSNLDLAIDAIGDCAVTVTNMMGCMGINPNAVGVRADDLANPEEGATCSYDLYDLDGLVNLFVQHVSVVRPQEQPRLSLDVAVDYDEERQSIMNEYHFVVALGALEHCSRRLGLTFEDCQEHAWTQIKDRKGMLIAGSFVKEENIPATAASLLNKAMATVMPGLVLGTSDEDYLSRLQAALRANLGELLNPEAFGLYTTVGCTITDARTLSTEPDWLSLEAMTLIARLYLDLGDGVNVVTNYHSNISVTPNGAVTLLPETGEFELEPRVVDLIRNYHESSDDIGEQINAMGYLPNHRVNMSKQASEFDNGVAFVQLFVTSLTSKVQETAIVLV